MLFTNAIILALSGLVIARGNNTLEAKIQIEPYVGAPRAEFKTIYVPIDSSIYTNQDALAAVTTLFLVAPNNALCTPYKDEMATVPGGEPFSLDHPSHLATNPVKVGSIVCKPFGTGAN